MPYKIVQFDGQYSIQNGTLSIPRSSENRHYKQFIQEIALGLDTVEGPDIVEPSYVQLRSAEYPSMQQQADLQYWDAVNGTTVWVDTIKAIKDKYPKTLVGGVTVGDVPPWVYEESSQFLFNKQLKEYKAAVDRLSQYVLSEGRPEVKEMIPSGELVFNQETGEQEEVLVETVVQTAIEPLPATIEIWEGDDKATVRNPAIVQDEAERAAAQAIVDATPQEVKDAAK